MANAVYQKYMEAVIQASANSSLGGTVRAALVDTGTYVFNAAHEFFSSVTGVVGTPGVVGTKTFLNGLFDGADVTFTAVSGATVEAIVLYIDTGVAGTSRLIAYIDTGVTGLPVTPNGGDITIAWNASGIVQF